jgi:hypothetical protein
LRVDVVLTELSRCEVGRTLLASTHALGRRGVLGRSGRRLLIGSGSGRGPAIVVAVTVVAVSICGVSIGTVTIGVVTGLHGRGL